jgi:hypothetical protein
MILHETVFFENGTMEIRLYGDLRYLLRYSDLVLYENHARKVRGRTTAYQFRSVEQLRYDFEKDVTAAGGRLG